jgi:hypothetical protein
MCRRKASTDAKVLMQVPQIWRLAFIRIFVSILFYREHGRE